MIRMMRRWLTTSAMATFAAAALVFGLAPSPANAALVPGPCTFPTGGTWFGVTCWNSPRPLVWEYEKYIVPQNPEKQGATFSLWGGLQDTGQDAVLQNVLSWNGSSWSFYPEYFWGLGTSDLRDKQWTHIAVKAGDILQSTISASGCDGEGHCIWVLTAADLTTEQFSVSGEIGSKNVYEQLLGGVFEYHSGAGCIELPYNGIASFRNIQAKEINNTVPTPTFGNSTPDHQCSMVVKSNSTATDFVWKR